MHVTFLGYDYTFGGRDYIHLYNLNRVPRTDWIPPKMFQFSSEILFILFTAEYPAPNQSLALLLKNICWMDACLTQHRVPERNIKSRIILNSVFWADTMCLALFYLKRLINTTQSVILGFWQLDMFQHIGYNKGKTLVFFLGPAIKPSLSLASLSCLKVLDLFLAQFNLFFSPPHARLLIAFWILILL